MLEDKERYKVRIIPVNYEAGITIFGLNFKPRFLFEGGVLGLLLGGAGYIVLKSFSLLKQNTIGYCLALVLIGLFIGIKGINDEPISVFASNFNKFRKNKRTAYFNPIVKKKAKPYMAEMQDSDSQEPIEKLMSKFSSIKKEIDKRRANKARQYENIDLDISKLYFEDETEDVEKPYEYMTSTERKAKRKEQIKRNKQLQKMAKEMAKQKRG